MQLTKPTHACKQTFMLGTVRGPSASGPQLPLCLALVCPGLFQQSQEEVNLVTALVPSETACFDSSPGRTRRTAVWISREVMVGFCGEYGRAA